MIRTCDPQIRNLVLYPTELRALLVFQYFFLVRLNHKSSWYHHGTTIYSFQHILDVFTLIRTKQSPKLMVQQL